MTDVAKWLRIGRVRAIIHILFNIKTVILQESRALARKPHDAEAVVFGLNLVPRQHSLQV